MEGFVILFGSAAAGAEAPRDLDLVVGGEYSIADGTRLARAWWRKTREGLPLELVGLPAEPPPVEAHRQHESYSDGSVYLLRPRGSVGSAYHVLAGSARVVWVDVDSLPAAIRLATDGQGEAAAEMIARLGQHGGGRPGGVLEGRIPLSLAPYDAGKPVGVGGYEGDGPVALEQALARTAKQGLDALLRAKTVAEYELVELLETIRSAPGVWSGKRWVREEVPEPPLLAGLRKHWTGGSPLGCRGYVGETNVYFEYAPPPTIALVREIVEVCGQAS